MTSLFSIFCRFPVSIVSLRLKGGTDTISIANCSAWERQVSDLRHENITTGWATDEIIGLCGDGLSRITIRSSLLAEALDGAQHRKVRHSVGLPFGGVEVVEEVDDLLPATNDATQRSARGPTLPTTTLTRRYCVSTATAPTN
jgi:hypothetical protein